MQTQEFLKTVLSGEGYYCIFGAKQDKKIQKFYPSLETASEVAEDMARNGYDAYFALATYETGESRKGDNAKELKAFFLDIDCGPDAGSTDCAETYGNNVSVRLRAIPLAGYGIATRLEFMVAPVAFGIGSGLTTMVGIAAGACFAGFSLIFSGVRSDATIWLLTILRVASVSALALVFGAARLVGRRPPGSEPIRDGAIPSGLLPRAHVVARPIVELGRRRAKITRVLIGFTGAVEAMATAGAIDVEPPTARLISLRTRSRHAHSAAAQHASSRARLR